MLTKYGELPCYQLVFTFDHVVDSDRAWTAKFWFNAHNTTGKLLVAT